MGTLLSRHQIEHAFPGLTRKGVDASRRREYNGNMSRQKEYETTPEEENYFRNILKLGTVAWIIIVALTILSLSGCAPSVIQRPDLGSVLNSNSAIKKNVSAAQGEINTVLKDNAIIARPDLTMDLVDASSQLVAAQDTIGQQQADIVAKQQQVDAVVKQGNDAIAAKNAMEPKHKRDIQALVAAWILCSLACILGPLIFKAYPALILFPTSLEAVVCSIAAFLICSGIAGLLIAFGFL